MQLYEPHTLSPSGHVLKQLRTGLNILMMQMDIPGTMLPGSQIALCLVDVGTPGADKASL